MLSFINTSDDLNQRIRTIVPVDGKNIELVIKLRWYEVVGKWFMSVFDDQENPIIQNVPLLLGVTFPSANLLRAVSYKKVGCAYVYPLVENPSTPNPGRDNFGIDKEFALKWGDTDDR